ncbi:MAG: hypothetical protein ACYDA2_00955 [Acidimicrobiales bacterium]
MLVTKARLVHGTMLGIATMLGAVTMLGVDVAGIPSAAAAALPPSELCPAVQGVVAELDAAEQSAPTAFSGGNDVAATLASAADSGLGCEIVAARSAGTTPAASGGPSALCPVFSGAAGGLETLESGWNSAAPAGAPTFAQGAKPGQLPDLAGDVAGGANSALGCDPPITVPYPTASPTLTVAAPQSGTTGTEIDSSTIAATLSNASANDKTTLTFVVFGPSDSAPASCTSGGTTVGTATAAGSGTYHPSAGFTPTTAGDYWWYVSAPADSSDAAASSACPPTTETVVSPPTASSSATTTTNPCAPASGQPGYWEVASDGGVFSFVYFPYCGSMGGTRLNQPIVGLAGTPDAGGYWMTASDGGVFAFGDAAFHGSMGGTHLNSPVVAMALDPATGGYWLVAADGGVFAFDAPFFGSMGGTHLNKPVVGMAATPDGGGYWMVASDGGVFAFGDATFHGSMGGTTLAQPITGLATDSSTGGYWMVAADGGVFAFDAPYLGSMSGHPLKGSVVAISAPDGGGYYLAGTDGAVYSFGDAAYYGSMGGQPLNHPVVGIAT